MRTFLAAICLSLAAFAAALVMSPAAGAAEFKSGDRTGVAANEVIEDDLYITGGTVTIAGRVTGDVIAAAGEIEISGQVDGNVQVLGGQVEVTGEIGGAVRALAGDLTIRGDVEGDVLALGGTLTLRSSGRIGGDVLAAGGDVELLGPVAGEVDARAGTLRIANRVGGNVEVTADTVTLTTGARIAGDLRYTSRNEIERELGAQVMGATTRTEPGNVSPGDTVGEWLSSGLFRLFCGLIAGLVLVLALPRAAASVADSARTAPLTSFLLGLLLLIALPVLFLGLLVTVVGAPIGLAGLAVYFCVLYLSQVFLGLAIGRTILPKSWDTMGRGYNLLAMVIGVALLGGLRLIPVPFVDGGIALVTAILGLGAFVIAVRSARRPPALPAYA